MQEPDKLMYQGRIVLSHGGQSCEEIARAIKSCQIRSVPMMDWL